MKKETVIGTFRQQAGTRMQDLCLIDDQQEYTYERLLQRIGQIQQQLPDESRIGLVMDHGADQIAALMAAMASGMAAVPCEKFIPPARMEFMMEQAGVQTVLCDEELDLPFEQIRLDQLPFQPAWPEDLACGQDEAYVLYTSGTSGRPKGVSIRQENLLHYVQAFNGEFHVQPEDRMLQYSVCSFDIYMEEVFASLLNGAALVIPDWSIRSDLPSLLDYAAHKQVTMISGFPYLLRDLNDLNPVLPASLRLLISGGDVLRSSYIEHLKDQVMIYNTYGPSETTVCASYCRVDSISAQPDGTFAIGHPVKGVKMWIGSPFEELPAGQMGEICIAGGGVGNGYIDPQTAEQVHFVPTPAGMVYCSGDLGSQQEDGTFLFYGRKDDQVMIDGRRVEPAEVENVLNGFPEVDWAVVRAFFDEQNLAYLCAYVVMNRQAGSLDLLKQKLADYVPDFMIPEFFIRLNQIPLTDHGKVDTRALPRVSRL